MIVVGLSTEGDAVGAIGTTGAFTSLVVNLFIGLSVGANVVVARHLGAGDHDRASVALHTSTVVGLLLGVVGGVFGILISEPVMRLLGNQGRLLDLSVTYVRFYFGALPFHALSNYAISLHRAKGDTRTPLIVLSLSGILNVLLNLFFVLVCGMSVQGVALATGIAAAVSAAVLYANLARDKGPCHFSFKLLGCDRREVKQILLIGIPAGVQGALFSISNMLIQSSIIAVNNSVFPADAAYQPVVKGNAAAANLEGFAYTAVNAMQQAAVTFTSQNVGAAKYGRVKRVMACCYGFGLAVGLAVTAILLSLMHPLLALYGVKEVAGDPLSFAAYEAGKARMMWTLLPYAIIALMEVGSGVLRGLGKSITPMIVSLLGSCVFRVVWIYTIFALFPTLEVLYISYPISWIVTAAAHFLFCFGILKNTEKREAAAVA
jgi:putative MATE family efflux protein